jgi:hypothetical protein
MHRVTAAVQGMFTAAGCVQAVERQYAPELAGAAPEAPHATAGDAAFAAAADAAERGAREPAFASAADAVRAGLAVKSVSVRGPAASACM